MKKINEIKGYETVEDFYFVTTCGKVISDRGHTKEIGYIEKNKGSVRVFLEASNKKKRIIKDVHTLVADAYIPEDHSYRYVIHNNGIKTDNYVGNLTRSNKKKKTAIVKKTENMTKLLEEKENLTKKLLEVEKKIQNRLAALLRKSV